MLSMKGVHLPVCVSASSCFRHDVGAEGLVASGSDRSSGSACFGEDGCSDLFSWSWSWSSSELTFSRTRSLEVDQEWTAGNMDNMLKNTRYEFTDLFHLIKFVNAAMFL